MTQDNQAQRVLTTALLAGRIMMEAGSEAYRVEDTMLRIVQSAGYKNSESYVTATGIFLSLNEGSGAQIQQARRRSTNFEKIAATNQLSRQFVIQEISLDDLYRELRSVDLETQNFKTIYRILAAGIVSAALMLILGGSYYDIYLAIPIGAFGYYISMNFSSMTGMLFVNDLIASMLITMLVVFLDLFALVSNFDGLIIGCIMPLVPGLSLTAAMRDLFSGHLLTGMVRTAEAVLTSSVIGIGIALILNWIH